MEVDQATGVDSAVCWDNRRANGGAADWQSAWENRQNSERADVSLHKYLANRYADMVVLTFSQLEDLLGFALQHCVVPSKNGGRARTVKSRRVQMPGSWPAERPYRISGARTVTFERPTEPLRDSRSLA